MCGIGEMADTAILGVAAERHKSSSLLSRTTLGGGKLNWQTGALALPSSGFKSRSLHKARQDQYARSLAGARNVWPRVANVIPAQVINAVLYGPDVGEGVGGVAGEAFA